MECTTLSETSANPRRVLGGKYELLRVIGRGSMGEVWVAEHKTLREEVAIKLLTRAPWAECAEESFKAAARFRFEAQVAARLSRRTRHIVRVTDHGEDDGVSYLTMELLDGVTLEAHLMKRDRMSPADVSALVSQIARALEQAHGEGVLHRDLKPSNVFLTKDEDGKLLAKVFDFGIACLTRAHRVLSSLPTGAGLIFGTPGYMSPEQARAQTELDPQCDLWALSTLAYEALTGELPLAGADTEELIRNVCACRVVPLRERAPDLPEALNQFFQRAFAEDPEQRFASATELATAFDDALRQTSTELARVPSPATLVSAPDPAQLAPAMAEAPSVHRGNPRAGENERARRAPRSQMMMKRNRAAAAAAVTALGLAVVAVSGWASATARPAHEADSAHAAHPPALAETVASPPLESAHDALAARQPARSPQPDPGGDPASERSATASQAAAPQPPRNSAPSPATQSEPVEPSVDGLAASASSAVPRRGTTQEAATPTGAAVPRIVDRSAIF